MIKQIAAEKELADMYEELKIVENVADLGKNVKKLEDFYNRPASEARFAMGLFYSDENVNALRRKTSPIKLPKGRYNI